MRVEGVTVAQREREAAGEVVAVFHDARHFKGAVRALRKVGFEPSDLSVLASHESLDAAVPPEGLHGGAGETIGEVLRALVGELKFAGPLGAAGIAVLFGGPMTATVGAVIAAGVGGMALKEVLSEVLSHPHPEHFARAVEAGGIILWVWVADRTREAEARAILSKNGGSNVHLHRRKRG